MATGDTKPEKDFPALVPGESMTGADSKQPALDAIAKKLYQEAQAATFQILAKNGDNGMGGSGFFEKSSHLGLTNSHIVIGQEEFFVVTSDGKNHQAKLVDLDDIKDLAKLEVPDLDMKNQHSLSLSDHPQVSGDKVFALGHPQGSQDVYISPGTVLGRDIMLNLLSDVAKENGHPHTNAQILEGMTFDMPDAQAKDVEARLQQLMDFSNAHVEPGNSGGPFVNNAEKVVGAAATTDGSIVGMVTLSDLRSFLNDNEHKKFSFEYENQSSAHVWLRHWTTDPFANIKNGYKDAGLAGIGIGTMNSGKFMASSLSFGILAGKNLIENYHRFMNSASTIGKVEAGIAMAGDSAALIGSAALMVPKVRRVGELAIKAGAAVWTASHFLPSHLILTKTKRVEGPDRPPTPFDN